MKRVATGQGQANDIATDAVRSGKRTCRCQGRWRWLQAHNRASVKKAITLAYGREGADVIVNSLDDAAAAELVNNAGIFPRVDSFDMTEAQWDDVLTVNLKGTFFCTQAVTRQIAPAPCAQRLPAGARHAARYRPHGLTRVGAAA